MSNPNSKQAEVLAKRLFSPGEDRSFIISENTFVNTLELILPKSDFKVTSKPQELKKMFAGDFGIIPDAKIEYLKTGKSIYFEVKKQKDGGNAEERGFKTHTVQFQKIIHEKLGFPYHPFVLIFCESLAENHRYTTKFEYYLEPLHYLCRKNYDLDLLYSYLRRIINDWFSYQLPSIKQDFRND